MGWSDKMEEDAAELEEGEAALYYKDDDDNRSIDPDIALSYIDEKLQSVLGHFQKDFEGGVSAENLGAKFGGYGSFLPTYQRSPPKPKNPPRVQTQSAAKSPNPSHREGASQNSTAIPDAQLSRRNGATAPHIRQASHETKVSSGDVPFRKDSLSSAKVAEKLPVRYEPSPNKSLNPTDQGKLKFRIKVGSDKAAQKNDAIYSGLGLISPSPSTGNSPGESGGISSESREAPDESPSIIQDILDIVPSPFSPVEDRFINLARNSSLPHLKTKCDHSGISMEDPDPRLYDGDALPAKRTKPVGKSETHKQSKHGNGVAFEYDSVLCLKDSSGAECPLKQRSTSFDMTQKRPSHSLANTNTGESLRDPCRMVEIVREPENGELIRKKRVSKDKVKGRILGTDSFEPLESVTGQSVFKVAHHEARSGSVEKIGKNLIKASEGISLDHSENKSKSNRIPASVKVDSDFSESDRDSKGTGCLSLKKSAMRATSNEQDELRMTGTPKRLESKKKSRACQVNGKLSSDSVQESRRAGSSLVAKEKMGIRKDVPKVRDLYKDVFKTNSEASGRSVDLLEKPSADRSKEPKFDATRLKEKSSQRKLDNQLHSEALSKNLPAGSLPAANGPALQAEQATVAPVVIEEDWVCCDRCQRWRLLPYGTKPEQLPEKWLCSMLNWLPGMNRCDISEEETTKALHSLYQLPPPENQNGAQYLTEGTAHGVNSLDQYNHSFQNISSDYMADGRKMQHKLNETSSKRSKAGLTQTLAARKFNQDVVQKKGTLNDKKQPSPGVNPVDKSIGQHPSKSDNAVEKYSKRQKPEYVTGDNANLKRKIKRESDEYELGISKKFKSDGAFDVNNSQCFGGNLVRTGLGSTAPSPILASVKEEQRSSAPVKDAKAEKGNGLQASAKKRVNIVDTASLDMKNYSDSDISAKKRHLKNWQNGPYNMGTLQNDGSYLNVSSMPVKEESGDSGFRRNKKPRVSQNVGEDFGRNVCKDELTRNDMMSRPLSSSDKEKQPKKHRIKISSQLTMEELASLRRELGSEPLSTAATSSSSKISDSRKTRTNHQEVKGSPVESVSSSPMRMSIPNKFSPTRMDSLNAGNARAGDFPTTRSPRKSVERDSNYDTKRSTKAKKKASAVLHPESLNNPVLDFRETVGRDKVGGKSEAGPKPSPSGDGHLDDNHLDILEGHSPHPTSKVRVTKNHQTTALLQQISGKSSLPTKDKGRVAGASFEGLPGKVSDLLNNQETLNPKQAWRIKAGADQSQVAPSDQVSHNLKHDFTSESSLKPVKKKVVKMDSKKRGDSTNESQLKGGEHESRVAKLDNPGSVDTTVHRSLNQSFQSDMVKNIDTHLECRNGNLQVDQHCQDKRDIPTACKLASRTQNGDLLPKRSGDISIRANVSKESKDLRNVIHLSESRHGKGPSADDRSARHLIGPSLVRRDVSGHTASVTLKEAEDLRDYADHLKNSGFGYECNEAYFQAALKFLLGASLLESSESSRHGETNQMQIYINTAKLCETCAQEYERREEMAAAALAYKCMEVAYMRVVYCKNSSTNRLWHDLQTSLQMVPQGESPSSSASDIDNLNNQALVDKASSSKSNGPHSANIIGPRSHPNLVRLLDFTKDASSAMEASRKSQVAFSAANVILDDAQNKEGVISIKRIIDFSFQDVEEFVRLVGVAIEVISRQGFSGSRD